MPISHEYKAIFVHIPKTAGESIENKLGCYGEREDPMSNLWGVQGRIVLQHLTASQIKQGYVSNNVLQSYFKFAIVRNPWDKAISEYHWYLRYGRHISFKDWVRSLPKKLEMPDNVHILGIGHDLPQYEFIYDADGKLLIDYIGRFENLQNDFNHICNVLGIKDSSLPKLTSTSSQNRRHYKDYYDNETIDLIAKIYQKDIELFSYQY